MKLGITESDVTARHGNVLGCGILQPLKLESPKLVPEEDAHYITVHSYSLFEIPKGRIVAFAMVDGSYVILPNL